jgi:cell division protein FtsW
MKTAATTLIFCVGSLIAMSMVMLYSSVMTEPGSRFLMLQGAWCALGIVACFTAAMVDYRVLKKLAIPLMIVTFLMLLAVFVPSVGVRVKGSSRWINLYVCNFQPSEVAKVVLIIGLAWYGDRFQKHIGEFWRGLVLPGLMAMGLILPIFFEPDRGTTILLSGLTMVLLVVAGVRWFYLVPPGALGAAAISFLLMHDPIRRARILSWLSPDDHKSGVGYQSWQAMLALGSGGVTGLGLGNGLQKLGFVPEQHTDFILSVIGEEMGVVATMAVVCAFIAFIIAGVYIAWHSRDVFGLLLGTGITFLVGMQAFINIGVVTSTLPNKGLALPFISYGGSSMLSMLGALGILLSIARVGRPTANHEEEPEETDLRSAQYA